MCKGGLLEGLSVVGYGVCDALSCSFQSPFHCYPCFEGSIRTRYI